ncbi:MAG TPA: hypothetical protein VJM83_01530 [Nitrospirota bacterium]|nr:hypothetical protein [Nitrospirota bacterium]
MFFRLFSKAEPDDSGSVPFFAALMDEAAGDVRAAFARQYGWQADEAEKAVESLLLSKFLMDHALVSTFCDRISKKRLRNLLVMLDMIYESRLKKLAPETKPGQYSAKFREYSAMLMGNRAPKCWQLIAGRFSGLELEEEKPTPEKFPAFLPELFIKVRDRLKEIVK